MWKCGANKTAIIILTQCCSSIIKNNLTYKEMLRLNGSSTNTKCIVYLTIYIQIYTHYYC